VGGISLTNGGRMFASIRCYFVHKAPTAELAQRVDDGFAELIGAQPGFISYEFLDCGEGEAMTISVFRDAIQAAKSRELARRWTEEALKDFELTITEALHGEILVSRATRELLVTAKRGAAAGFTAVRRYRLQSGSVTHVMQRADQIFAEQLQQLEGFVAYHALDCGNGGVISVSRFRERAAAERSDDLAARFAQQDLGDVDIRRTEWIGGGTVVVSRANAEALEPAHA
jgi:hypothetical protein